MNEPLMIAGDAHFTSPNQTLLSPQAVKNKVEGNVEQLRDNFTYFGEVVIY